MLELEDAKATIGRVLTQRAKKKSDVQMVKPQDALGELSFPRNPSVNGSPLDRQIFQA